MPEVNDPYAMRGGRRLNVLRNGHGGLTFADDSGNVKRVINMGLDDAKSLALGHLLKPYIKNKKPEVADIPHEEPKLDPLWVEARNLVFMELLDLQHDVVFFKLAGYHDKLADVEKRVRVLGLEVSQGYLRTIAKLQNDEMFKPKNDAIIDSSMEFDAGIYNPFEDNRARFGIKMASMDGWKG